MRLTRASGAWAFWLSSALLFVGLLLSKNASNGVTAQLLGPKTEGGASPNNAEVATAVQGPNETANTLEPNPALRKEVLGAQRQASPPEISPEIVLGVAGRILVLGGATVARSELNGMLEVVVSDRRSTTPFYIDVEEGLFQLAFKPMDMGRLISTDEQDTLRPSVGDFHVDFRSPEFGDIGATVLSRSDGQTATMGELRIPFGKSDAVVYIKPAPLTQLHIVDKQTGKPLQGVRVTATQAWRAEEALHPKGSKATSITLDTASPVTLHPPRSFYAAKSVTAFAWSEGYAWASTAVDLRNGGEQTVELVRGGTLRISIEGDVPPAGRLRLFSEGQHAPASEVAVNGDGSIVYGALAPGNYSVAVELGEYYRRPTRLCYQEVTVEEGAEAHVHLSVTPVISAPRAEAAGVLFLPPAWDLDSFRAMIELTGNSSDGSDQSALLRHADFTKLHEEPNAYSFTLPPLEIGKYEFTLLPFGWKQNYDLPPEGRTDLRFELPEPVELTVNVVHMDTGLPADVGHLTWHPAWQNGSRGGFSMAQIAESLPGRFQFKVTRGQVYLYCHEVGHKAAQKTLEMNGPREVTLRIPRANLVHMTLRSGDHTVPWPEGGHYDLEPIGEGDRYDDSDGWQDGARWFTVNEPGRYRLTVPEVSGYQSHGPVEIDVLEGERLEVVIDLVPR